MEGARIASCVALPRDVHQDVTIVDGDKTLNLKEGERVIVNLVRSRSASSVNCPN